MRHLTNEQTDIITACDMAVPKILLLADKARRARLFILEGELRHQAKAMKDAVDLQARAFRDDTLCDDDLPLFPFGKR